MAESLGSALLDLGTNDNGFDRGIARAEGRANALGKTLTATSGSAQRLARDIGKIGAEGGAFDAHVRAAHAHRAALDDVRARFNPVFASIRQYRTALGEIRQAHAMGAISADEMAAAIQRERAATLGSIAALKGRATALNQVARASGNAAMQQKMLLFQLNDIGVSLASGMNPLMVMVQQGSQISQIYGPGEGGVGRALKETGNMALGLVKRFPLVTAAIALGTAAVAGMTHEINAAGKETVTFGDTATAVWQVIADSITEFLQPAFEAIAPYARDAWEKVVAGAKWAVNTTIKGWQGAIVRLQAVWAMFPFLVGDAVVRAVNWVIDGINRMIAFATQGLNALIRGVNAVAGVLGFDGQIGEIEAPAFKRVANPYAGVIAAARTGLEAELAAIDASDPAGAFFDAVAERARANARARAEKDKDKDKAGSGGAGAGARGPSPEELAALMSELQLEQAIAVARARGDEDALRILEREQELRSKIERYRRAGLDLAQATAAAEKDMAELDQAKAEANARALADHERDIEIQLAELRGDYEHLKVLRDQEFVKKRIAELQKLLVPLAEAERRAAEDLLHLEQARADQAARRASEQAQAHAIELAELRGDRAEAERLREESRVRARAEELHEGGLGEFDAQQQALAESMERAAAAQQGNLRALFHDTFGEGIRAALRGDLKGFLDNFFEGLFNRALTSATDGLFNLLFGQQGAGGGGGGGLGGFFSQFFAGMFATGGLIPTGQFGIVGERGPEPVIGTRRGAMVLPNSSLRGLAGGGRSVQLNMPVTIDANGADPAQLARVREGLDQLRAELPSRIVNTVQEAGDRRVLNTGAWR